MISQNCPPQETETEEYIIIRCFIYYEVQDRFHCLYRDLVRSLATVCYPNYSCLALYLQEEITIKWQAPANLSRHSSTMLIIAFFLSISTNGGVKHLADTVTMDTEK